MRAVKTLGRKAIGVDARFASALARGLGVERFPERVLQIDATDCSQGIPTRSS